MNLRRINAPDAPQPPVAMPRRWKYRRHTHALRQRPDPDEVDGTVPESFEDQARLAWKNVFAQLRAADMTLDNLVKVTIFLSDRKYIADYRKVATRCCKAARSG